MAPERKLYQKLKKNITSISWIRLENLSSSGTPDLLGYNNSGTFFTVELKVTKGIKIKFSPHQIAWHVKHPKNTFILVEALGPRAVNRFQLFPGSGILALEACGLKLEPFCLGLDACSLLLDSLGAWSLLLVACSLRPGPGERWANSVELLHELIAWSSLLRSFRNSL